MPRLAAGAQAVAAVSDVSLRTEEGKTLGVVGFGRIGRAVAQRALGLEMKVTAFDPFVRGETALNGAVLLSQNLEQLLRASDCVTLHATLSDETRHLIGQPEFARMKRTAYLVNTSRGPVVDEGALVWALKNRLIAGAGLDVYEREPEIHEELFALENVVLAPHLGSATTDTRTGMADLAVRNVLAVLSGAPPLTPVP